MNEAIVAELAGVVLMAVVLTISKWALGFEFAVLIGVTCIYAKQCYVMALVRGPAEFMARIEEESVR